jgi:uncharacterized protein YecE (DUF72 family)
MHFGRIASLNDVDFGLPNDRQSFCAASTKTEAHFYPPRATELLRRVGLPLWSKKEFVGPVYPEGTRAKDFLRAYGQRFLTIELNASHYRVPDAEKIHAWCNEVPESFTFCPKVPQTISHSKLAQVSELLLFAKQIEAFGTRLGPCFLQLPEYADKTWKRTIFELTRAFPPHLKLALELRHPDWFSDAPGFEKLGAYLGERNIALIMTDTPGRRDVLHMARTAPYMFIRFLGNSLHESDFARIDAWSKRIQQWAQEGIETYFFLHQPNEVDCMPLFEALSKALASAT